MVKLNYDLYFFHKSCLVKIVGIQTNDRLILVNNNFANKKEKTVRDIKIITKH